MPLDRAPFTRLSGGQENEPTSSGAVGRSQEIRREAPKGWNPGLRTLRYLRSDQTCQGNYGTHWRRGYLLRGRSLDGREIKRYALNKKGRNGLLSQELQTRKIQSIFGKEGGLHVHRLVCSFGAGLAGGILGLPCIQRSDSYSVAVRGSLADCPFFSA